MKRLLFVLVLLATPAFAADAPRSITLTATPEELQALDQLIASSVEHPGGFSIAENAVYWHKKLVQAITDANKPIPDTSKTAPDTKP